MAKAAILTLLAARDALDDVQKRYSAPTEDSDITYSMIWLGEEVTSDDDWSQLGAQRRRVTFRIPFTIAALHTGDDPQATDALAWSYFDELIAALRSDPTLGGAVQQFDLITSRNRVVPTGPQQWEASITGTVICTSRAY
jgi:hypothetical protein